ncbi:MAG: C40 family peptidase [Ignavibacteriaceae bacterium]|jgi:cell wall-associated NlpC family hydrolase
MKRTLEHLLIILTISLVINAQQSMKNIEDQIHEVKNSFAPDKRTAIFDLQVAEEGGNYILRGETNLPNALDTLFKRLSGVKIEDEVKRLPDEILGEKSYGIVNISVANIRTKPEHSAEMATQALLGTIVKIYKKTDDGWYLIQTPDNYISWVDGDAIELVTLETADAWKNENKVIFTRSYGSAFENSSPQSGIVSDLVFGNILKLLSVKDDFYEVEFPDGRNAAIKQNEAEIFSDWVKSRQCSKENIIATAKKFMGIPYLWGGTSTKGLDCSGFTKTVYFSNGVVLPRDASQQVFVGELINTEKDFSNLQPGDLLFFGFSGNANRKERITHVAVYLGEEEFIHSSGRVRINSFNKSKTNFSKHRLSTFIRAKRIVTSVGQKDVQPISSNPFYN